MVIAASREVSEEVRFCRAADGTRLAYASHGLGPPLVVVSCWLSNLRHDWASPVWRHFLDDLGEFATVVRYDERGFGLSDRNVTDFSLDARLTDLEAVIDAVGLRRFALLGMSGTSPAAIAYAARHPDRVTRLIMYGGTAGWSRSASPDDEVEEAAYQAMVRAGWARADPRFRRVFTTGFIPNATDEQMRWFDELQRTSTSTENMLAARIERHRTDVRPMLPGIATPTLVLHATGDRNVPFEHARELAARIPDARLVPLDSINHILLADEPAWRVFVHEVREFLEPDRLLADEPSRALATLSTREREILRLASSGLSNDEIARHLTLSSRTVERHLSNIYAKLGLSGRTARAAAVAALFRATA